MPMTYDLLTPQLQALVAAAGLATACVMDAVHARAVAEAPTDSDVESIAAAAAPQRARLLLPPTAE